MERKRTESGRKNDFKKNTLKGNDGLKKNERKFKKEDKPKKDFRSTKDTESNIKKSEKSFSENRKDYKKKLDSKDSGFESRPKKYTKSSDKPDSKSRFKRNSEDKDSKFEHKDKKYTRKKDSQFSNTDKKFSKDSKPYDRKNSEFSDKKRTYKSDKKSNTNKKTKKDVSYDGFARLNKYISNAGICSRREADDLISAGLVTVNGKIVTELGTKVSKDDDIRFNGQRLVSEKKVYILLNKPKDFVTTVDDPHADRTVLDLIKGACNERVYPVGRLDKQTTGVLLLTNDGELTKKLTHPKYKKKKIYLATLDSALKKADFMKLVSGIDIDGEMVSCDAVNYVDNDDKTQIGVEIHFGMNRIVRRLFEALGYKVKKLDRVYFAGLTKKGLQRGYWRHLNLKEVATLKMGSYE